MKNKFLHFLVFLLLSTITLSSVSAQITFDNVPPLSGGGNTAGGVSFNFTTNQSITVQNLRCAFSTATGTATIWYRPQKINGAPVVTTANGWISLGSATFAGLSPASTSPVVQTIPVPLNLVMQPQDTFGFFIQWTGNVYPTPNTAIPTFTNGTVTIIADAKSAFTGTGTTPTFNPRQINGGVIYTLNAPCVAPPNGGQTTASVPTVCPNTNFQLTLTGATLGTGLTYQWQSSPNGTTGWTNIAGATSSNLTTTQTTTTHYRAQLTCSGQTASSLPVQVTTNATPVSGTFTINKGAPASASNFQSFTAALASIECGGANGPIVFNVAPNSGPYNEQVVVPVIPGTSATNTVTFNGNGNTVVANPSGANLGVITLNGADFVKFDNLVLNLDAAATTGWGVQLMNEANNNTITNSTINLPLTSTSTNVNGIVFGATATTAANNGNNNIFSNNTINGGYYAFRINGPAGTTGAIGNQFINNTIRDNYAYNVYLSNAEGTLIEGNNISRPTRTAVTTFYGVYMTGTSKNNIISKNRFHNTHGAATSLTGTVYGIYHASTDAPAGSENISRNNLIYNINNTGTIYGIYNTGSDGAYYYHNTIDLTHAANTGTVRGVYQTTAATNIKFQNNIFVVGPGASGTKHVLYYNTTTSGITSDNNVLHAIGTANIGSWGTANQATLAAWRTASSKDANSVAADPQFVDPATANFRPTNVAVNNIGAPLGVTEDITGATRSTTTPDPGAYEFSVNPNDVGITAVRGARSGCGLTATQSITITVKNFGSAPQSNIPVNFLVNNVVVGTGTIAGPLNPNDTIQFTFSAPANLAAPGPYAIVANTLLTGDADPTNDTFTLNVTNALIPNLPIALNFETPATGIGATQIVTRTRSNVYEATGASNGVGSTKGMIMDGVDNPAWVVPIGVNGPWTTNPEHFSAVYMCINPSAGPALDSLLLYFDMMQLYKGAAANTNFRVTVNGTQVGPTYTPPFGGPSTTWQRIRVDLTAFKTLSSVQIGLESSVKEGYQNGNGTANLIDNLMLTRHVTGLRSDILSSQVKVYPNPSQGMFSITAPKGRYSIEITDMTGRVVLKQNATAAETQLNLKDAAKGIYLLKLTSEGQVATKRLVIE